MQANHQSADKSWLTLDLFTSADDERPVFITGNFNKWVPNEQRFQLDKLEPGRYQIKLKEPLVPSGTPFHYKYVKGDWSGAELSPEGLPSSNRSLLIAKGSVTDVVKKWKQNTGQYAARFFPKINIVSEHFQLPHLNESRRISVLLPHDYDIHPSKHYPVLYLQDGQNLFDDDAPYGSWNLDDQLGKMAEAYKGDIIVVAIDHGGKNRFKEYSPYPTEISKEALGREYAIFLTETLKPHIDSNFRTLSDVQHTAIGGSSMGGLISIYAGIMHPDLFSKYMIFSPSLWVSEKIYEESLSANWFPDSKMYLFAGANEGHNVVKNLTRWSTEMSTAFPSIDFDIFIDIEANHSEFYWGRAFPKAMEFLFGKAIEREVGMLELAQ